MALAGLGSVRAVAASAASGPMVKESASFGMQHDLMIPSGSVMSLSVESVSRQSFVPMSKSLMASRPLVSTNLFAGCAILS